MKTVKIYQLNHLSYAQFKLLQALHMEAAKVWNCCMEMHKAARLSHEKWPGRDELQKATQGRFALHSQSVQMSVHTFLANIGTTHLLRQEHPQMRMKYPWRKNASIQSAGLHKPSVGFSLAESCFQWAEGARPSFCLYGTSLKTVEPVRWSAIMALNCT